MLGYRLLCTYVASVKFGFDCTYVGCLYAKLYYGYEMMDVLYGVKPLVYYSWPKAHMHLKLGFQTLLSYGLLGCHALK